MQCDAHCSDYKPCISPCGVETCDNLISKDSKLCSEDTCVEGCQLKPCPEGQIYANDSYTECVPKSVCRPVCLTVNGVDYFEGDEIKSDNCQACHCSKGSEVCIGVPCTSTSILPYHVPPVYNQDASQDCKSGWSEWINQERMPDESAHKNLTKFNDHEPLPNAFMLKNYKNSAFCDADYMIQIECRCVRSHLHPKEMGEDAECSLERGLVCQGNCHDYEIRVLCSCNDDVEIFTIPSVQQTTPRYIQPVYNSKIIQSTTETPSIYGSICTPNAHVEKPGNCHEFYHCTMNTSGSWVYVEKTCGNDMMFNPEASVCDFIDNVKRIKPQCGELEHKVVEHETVIEEISIVTKDKQDKRCPQGKIWSDCAVPCGRACHFYDKYLQHSGLCTGSWNGCEKGCVSELAAVDCAPGYFWRDDKVCVKKADCTCQSDDGKVVRPGSIYKESDCKICQCIDNLYVCDEQSCKREEVSVITVEKPVVNQTIEQSVIVTKKPTVKPPTHVIINTITPPADCAPEK